MTLEKKNSKILVVEDDLFMLELLVRELQKADFEIIVAKTGTEGVKKFREENPDLILLDIILPDLNGFDALREIRREKDGHAAKVIILSNLGDEDDKEEAKRLGVLDYMVKANFTLSEIVEKVKKCLE